MEFTEFQTFPCHSVLSDKMEEAQQRQGSNKLKWDHPQLLKVISAEKYLFILGHQGDISDSRLRS